MTLQEFAALKVGDKIENLMSNSRGVVSEVTDSGVRVQWSRNDQVTRIDDVMAFTYTVNSTAWMHWTYAPRDCVSGPCYREDCRRSDKCVVHEVAA